MWLGSTMRDECDGEYHVGRSEAGAWVGGWGWVALWVDGDDHVGMSGAGGLSGCGWVAL